MANFNNDVFNVDALSDYDKKQIGVCLQALLTTEELTKLKDDWNKNGGHHVVPLWKFAFDNIQVKYDR